MLCKVLVLNSTYAGCPVVREKSGKFVVFFKVKEVREFCKMVREIRKSSKVREF